MGYAWRTFNGGKRVLISRTASRKIFGPDDADMEIDEFYDDIGEKKPWEMRPAITWKPEPKLLKGRQGGRAIRRRITNSDDESSSDSSLFVPEKRRKERRRIKFEEPSDRRQHGRMKSQKSQKSKEKQRAKPEERKTNDPAEEYLKQLDRRQLEKLTRTLATKLDSLRL